MEDRTQELEAKISFVERSVEQLNEVIIEQGNLIEAMQKEIVSLQDKITDMKQGDIEPHDTPPPHY